jgi:hypothetical protein
MQLFQVTLWVYGIALRRSWECVRRNWVVSFAPIAYSTVLSLVAMVAAPFGIVGGLLLGLASQACLSSGLNLIKNMIDSGKADFNDFIKGFTVYIWDLLTVAFIIWIPLRMLAMVLATVPNGGIIYFCIQLALYIFLNAVPELIYQTRVSGLEAIGASYHFIVENWLEWLVPNLVLAVAGYWFLTLLGAVLYGLPLVVQLFVQAFALGLCLTYIMTFRGFLFAELHGSSRRARIYRYKAQS